MTVKLAIVGLREDGHLRATRGGSPAGQSSSSVTDALDDIQVVAYFNLSPSARERTAKPVVIELDDNDVLEIEVAGGFRIWTSAKRYRDEIVLLRPEAKVGDTVVVDTLPRVSRCGITDWAQNGLRVLHVKHDGIASMLEARGQWPSDLEKVALDLGITPATKPPEWFAPRALTHLIENRLTPGPGLYSWRDATREKSGDGPHPQPVTFDGFDVAKPMLVFIHGMASSTLGSFGAFLNEDARPQWQGLTGLFGDNIYAFEHRTISDSPVDNAIDLVTALPPNARINIVSHSRGGLVGDLLSLTSINPDFFAKSDGEDPELAQVHDRDRRQLDRLAELLKQKNLRFERFVRCASPSRGALLATENLDYLMSVLTNLVSLIPETGADPLYAVVKRLALEIISKRTPPALLPGIDAMTPGSPLIALLNNLDAPATGDLGVLAGDTAPGNWLKRLGVFATDQFLYETRDNDLVVNTDSMFHGARRDVSGFVFERGADVSHFNYFRDPSTRAAVVEWLSPPTDTKKLPDRFSVLKSATLDPVPAPQSPARGLATTGRTIDRPIVFIVPGIMGSELSVDGETIWLNYDTLLAGEFTTLADVAPPGERPAALVGAAYRELCDFLRSSHEVIPFPYDWRRSVTDAAELLAAKVADALDRTQQAVRFVAHGMGGLVVRAMICAHPDLWDLLCGRPGARLVMLGTPNRGSYEVIETLLGSATGVQQLAMLDRPLDAAAIAAMVASFPGVLELLPNQLDKADPNYFDQHHWQEQHDRYPPCAVPSGQLLTDAHATLEKLASQRVIPHSEHVEYVAGTSTRTVSGAEIVNGRVVLSVTNEGDGRVTYASGLLPGVSTWYMDAVHGDLPSHQPGLFAIKDLLETGTTDRLRTTPRSVEGGGQTTYRAFPVPVLYPTKTSLAAGFLGKNPLKAYRQNEQPGFRVSVVHGDLQYARYPIVVGHYEGDTIVGAEAQVDAMLGGKLKQRYALGLYPGEIRSLAVILDRPGPARKPADRLKGALVIGLGKWGDLTAAQLSELLRRAALQYVLELFENPDGNGKVGLSVLLIGGTSAANVAIADSVGAIIRAIAQANRELATPDRRSSSIEEVEIIELFADTAIEAAHAVNRLVGTISSELETDIEAAPLLQRGRDGRRRLTSTSNSDAWRRWEVSVVPSDPRPAPACLPKPLADRLKRAVIETNSPDRELVEALAELAIHTTAEATAVHREIKFLTLSDRARAESTKQVRQPELVERLIKDSISHTYFSPDQSRVLFELMIPNDLKSGLARMDNLVLVLDAESAAYPWELMSAADKPLCVAKGLVRQLQTSAYRSQIGARAGSSAYVVGDPKVSAPFDQLPGAHAEAKAVYELLLKPFDESPSSDTVTTTDPPRRFDVAPLQENPTALQVLAGLYKKPYRIVHIAGHGHYEAPSTADGTARSGVVLDNGLFLTAVEIGQMQQVPELVFLNCCHIGQTGPDAPQAPGVDFNRLAASISRELIEMGVRAVVAAGWAVEDKAAEFFATEFYSSMVQDGEPFGRAITLARTRTYNKFPATNTWGAYQAYGDPDYRLFPSESSGAGAPHDRVDAAELIEAVTGIRRQARYAVDADAKSASITDLEKLVRTCPTDWLARADVRMEIGYAFGSLDEFGKAGDHLRAAIADDGTDGATTMQAVEELATYQACQDDDGLNGQAQDEPRIGAISRLENLIAVAPTARRYSRLGDFYTRRACTEDAKDARESLTHSATNYRKAYECGRGSASFDPCAALRWLAATAILNENAEDSAMIIERCEATAAERFRTDGTFQSAVGIAEAALVRALTERQLTTAGDARSTALHHLRDLYQKAFRDSGASAADRLSAATQVDTAIALITNLWPKCQPAIATVESLTDLRALIGNAEECPVSPAQP